MGKVVSGSAYSNEEINFLKENYGKMTSRTIGEILGRSSSSVKVRAKKLGLVKPPIRLNWSNEDVDFIKGNFDTMLYKDIAKHLNKTELNIRYKVHKLGLKKYIGYNFSKEDEQFLIDNYKDLTSKEIAKILDKKTKEIERKVLELGLKKPKYLYNKHYFKTIDTEEKSYWLGFLYADGYVRDFGDKKRVGIGLQLLDKPHLEKFVQSISGNIEIKTNEEKNSCGVSVCCTEMADDLIKLGCVPRKTYKNIVLPSISHDLMKHFIRGFIDGDGGIYEQTYFSKQRQKEYTRYSMGITSNYKTILEQIQKFFSDNNIKSFIQERKDCCYLQIGSKQEVIKSIKLLYKDSKIYLDRKYKKAYDILQKN